MTDKIKITESNDGKHIAIAGDINSIMASKEDTGGTYSMLETIPQWRSNATYSNS